MISSALQTDVFNRLRNLRWQGDKFTASCPGPTHHRGDKHSSLSGEVKDRKILLHCFTGCSIHEICDGAGIEISGLFLDSPSRPPVRTKRDVAFEHLSNWRERKLAELCITLRSLDGVVSEIQERLEKAGVDSLEFNSGLGMSESDFDGALVRLANAYKLIPSLEHDFERLNGINPAAWAEVWQEKTNV